MIGEYVGRFAPSVTGPLHFGSLLAAVASFLDARAHGGRWVLRLDDLDIPRLAPGADTAILEALEAHALDWDGPVVRQSERTPAYRAAFETLIATGALFLCSCSRRQLAGARVYPGTCRARILDTAAAADRAVDEAAVRIRADAARVEFDDRVFGPRQERLDETTGDFIVRRRDGLFAYQLATVVDDAGLGVTDVVRGADLLDNTARQLFLCSQLGLAEPRHAHFPVIADRDGAKLSKQTFAAAIDARNAAMNLYVSLSLLGQAPPANLCRAAPAAILDWGRNHWRVERIPATPTFPGFVSI